MLPAIIGGFQSIANASNPLKFVYEAISYKPFLSLFNMTGVASTYPELAGIGMSQKNRSSTQTNFSHSRIRRCGGVRSPSGGHT